MEARVGIEPTNRGFADLGLTTWLPRPIAHWNRKPDAGNRANRLPIALPESLQRQNEKPACRRARGKPCTILERETGFEPATSTLARSHSTAELLPLRLTSTTSRSLGCARDFGSGLRLTPAYENRVVWGTRDARWRLKLLPLAVSFYSTCVFTANHSTRTALPHCPSGRIPHSAMYCS